jgi:hypothetical protein
MRGGQYFMNRGLRLGLSVMLIMALAGVVSLVGLCAGVPFSATLVQTDNKKKETLGKVFVSGQKIRQEITDNKGVVGISIIRLDKEVMWMLMTEDKQYIEYDFKKAKLEWMKQGTDMIESQTVLGTEMLNGYMCTKTKYVYKDKSYGTMIQWMADKLQFGIKTESTVSGKVSTTEYRDIKEGLQPDSLFEIPAGYTKFDLGGMFGNLGGLFGNK